MNKIWFLAIILISCLFLGCDSSGDKKDEKKYFAVVSIDGVEQTLETHGFSFHTANQYSPALWSGSWYK